MSQTPPSFSEVQVGQELPEIVKGPWTSAHIVRWHIAQENLERFHYDSEFARDVWGLPDTVANGNWRKYCIAQLCKDWIGYDGWVWKLEMRYSKMQFAGDLLTTWGRVKRTWEEDGLGFVELEGGMRNQHGVETTPSIMVVVLPLKQGQEVPYPFVPPTGSEDDTTTSPLAKGRILPDAQYVTGEVYERYMSRPPSPKVESWDEVDKSSLRRMVNGIPDHDPLYWDEDFAGKTRFGGIVAPYVYPVEAYKVPPNLPDQLEEEFANDPNGSGGVGDPRLRRRDDDETEGESSRAIHPDLTAFFNGGQKYEIFRLLHLGEKCVAQTRPLDVYEKQGAKDRFVVSASRTDYWTTSGELVMRADQYGVQMDPSSVPAQK
tara:strand:- start:370 stop:1494 length:1125 start_codon:yes stop_codon:yes gene_type:complete